MGERNSEYLCLSNYKLLGNFGLSGQTKNFQVIAAIIRLFVKWLFCVVLRISSEVVFNYSLFIALSLETFIIPI